MATRHSLLSCILLASLNALATPSVSAQQALSPPPPESSKQTTKESQNLEAQLVLDLANQQKPHESIAKATEVLTHFANIRQQLTGRGGRDCSQSLRVLFKAVDAFIENKNLKSASELNGLIDNFLTKNYGPKFSEQINCLERTAIISGATGEKGKQEQALATAFDLALWNWGTRSPKTTAVRSKYALFLRDVGRTKDALDIALVPSDKIEFVDENKMFAGDYIRSPHLPPPDVYLDTAEALLKKRIEQYSIEDGEGSQKTVRDIGYLTNFYLARKNYAEAEKQAKRTLSIWESIEGSSSDMQSQVMERIAEINFLSNKKQAALEWLHRADKANEFKHEDNTLRCAALYLEMGDEKRGLELLLQVSKAMQSDPRNVNQGTFAQCAYLLRRTGQTEELNKLDRFYEDEKQKRGARRLSADSYHGRGHTQTAPVYEKKDGVWTRETRTARILFVESQKHRLPLPIEFKLEAERARLETMKRNLPPGVLIGMRQDLEQSIAEEERKAKDQRAQHELQRKLDLAAADNTTDYATAEIAALQAADADRRAKESDMQKREQKRALEIQSILQRRTTNFDEAKRDKSSSPEKYLKSLAELAEAQQINGNADKAQELRIQCINEFLILAQKPSNPTASQVAFKCFERANKRLSQAQVIDYFKKMVAIAESDASETRESAQVRHAISSFIGGTERDDKLRIQLYEIWIPARSKRRGAKDFSLLPLLRDYASVYLRTKDQTGFDAVLNRLKDLNTANSDQRVTRDLEVANLLFKAKRPEEAERCWRQAGESVDWSLSKSQLIHFFHQAEFTRRSYPEQAAEMELLAVSRATKDNCDAIDKHLTPRIEKLLREKQYDYALKLIQSRMDGTKEEPAADPKRAYWQRKYIEVEAGRVLYPPTN